MSISTNYYWPYVEGEPIIPFEYIGYLGRQHDMNDGNSFYFGNVERYTDLNSNTVSIIMYFCSNTPHTHADRPSCSRFVMCFQLDASMNTCIMLP